jgi:hypothetical protein
LPKGIRSGVAVTNLAARERVERQTHPVCVSETSSSSPSFEAQLIPPACRRSCDRACGASRLGSNLSKRTWRPSWPWPPRERPCLSPAQSSWRTTSVPGLPVWSRASPAFHARLSWARRLVAGRRLDALLPDEAKRIAGVGGNAPWPLPTVAPSKRGPPEAPPSLGLPMMRSATL